MYRIPSIQQYCNRWCQRCPLSSLCGLYHARYGDEELDPQEWSGPASGEEPRHVFEEIDLKKVEALPAKIKELEDQGDFNPDASPILGIYDQWQGHYGQVLQHLTESWEQAMQKQDSFVREAHFLQRLNAREVLLHYRNFLGPKLHRALGGRFDAGGQIPLQSDWNGSAKVLILALNHLLLVLEIMDRLYPEYHQSIAAFQLASEDFKEQCLSLFPQAMAFKRPGFDDLSPDLVLGPGL
ncbi:hypothetical protein [Croceimicrobium hydrocarbonivorans]|uniref:Uncharacterized protein n=1 Tax=Croceimicrobium hydrocarbonivorans TaxID=2761580 RepID=A0A7H0VA08_9FLAO|nr:hypothetical protein [Croceimicrobium hydrocarbonivorans]QNR22556.1 hypothetical protein H4K34_09155 [Croceimicrobium hydrocarbonivorans]